MNITTFEELMTLLNIIVEKGYTILLDDRVADLCDNRIKNDFHFLDPDTFREGGYVIEPDLDGNSFSLHPADDDYLFHWIDIIQYQQLRVGDLSRGEVEIEELD